MQIREIEITHRLGLHARACARIVQLASRFRCNVALVCRRRRASARNIVEMMKVATDQLPVLFNFHNPNVHAWLSSLKGPALGTPDRLNLWNVHEWELTS